MQINNTLLSIIIPMYNCGQVITRCLDSIDYQEAEIIVVDDGSKDEGAAIVTRYAELHPNVRLIRKPNGGVSSARNVGIENAYGRYIMFIDVDDYIVPGGLERILNVAVDNDADVCKYWAKNLSASDAQDTNSIATIDFTVRKIFGKAEALKYYDLSDYIVWDGLYKRDLILSRSIRFKEDLHLHEDDEFMAELYCEAERVFEVNLPLYRYVVSSNCSAGKDPAIAEKRLHSSLLAIKYRQEAIKMRCPKMEFPLEKYKYMRYVVGCLWSLLHTPIKYKDYRNYALKFKELGCWPLQYKYIQVARQKITVSKIIKTFLCNHPLIAYAYKLCRH